MAPTNKNHKAMSRPLPGNLAPGDATSTDLVGNKKNKATAMVYNSATVSKNKVTKSKAPFRYTWQKKGSFAYQEALVEAENANNPGDKVKRRATTKEIDADGDDGSNSADENSVQQHTGGKTYMGGKTYTGGKRTLTDGGASDEEQSDADFKQEDSDDDYEGMTGSKQPLGGGGRRKKQKYEMKDKPPNPNGRVLGRKLVMWHRPRMVEKLMLHLQYECHRANIKLPWDKVVDRLSTGSSGQSALQHINKLRDILITEGHMVPPLLGKHSIKPDPTVRGNIRDMKADKPTDTRVVRWGEGIEDRKENLAIEGVIRGSGNYRRIHSSYQRGLSKALEKNQQATGERRNRLPVELRETPYVSNETAGAGSTIKKEKINKTRGARAVSRSASRVFPSRFDSPDPAELASDEEYDPSAKNNSKLGRRLRNRGKPVSKTATESSDDETDEEDIPAVAVNTPRNNRLKGHDQGDGLMTPPSTMRKSKIVTLHLRPEVLAKFGTGSNLKKQVLEEDDDAGLDHDLEDSGDDMENRSENRFDHGAEDHEGSQAFGGYDTPTRQSRQTSVHAIAEDIQMGYQIQDEHGTRAEYNKAMKNETYPTLNGLKNKFGPAPIFSSAHAPPAVPKSVGPLAGASASAVSGTAMTGMNDLGFGDVMSGIGGRQNASAGYGGTERMVDDPFFDGPSFFDIGSTPFGTSGLPAMSYDNNYHGTTGFDMGFDATGYFQANNSFNTQASSASSGLHSTDTATAAAPNDLAIHDDAVSVALSSPAHYCHYIREDDDQENHEQYGEFY